MGKNRAELVERRRDDGKERKKLAEDTGIGGEQGVNREREEEEEERERERDGKCLRMAPRPLALTLLVGGNASLLLSPPSLLPSFLPPPFPFELKVVRARL